MAHLATAPTMTTISSTAASLFACLITQPLDEHPAKDHLFA